MARNFNYISYGDPEVEPSDEIILGRGRLFEYTPIDTAKRLEGMRSDAIAFLEGLPTFLCSEVSRSGNGEMFVRFGRIVGTTVDQKRISATFQPIRDFGRIAFADEAAARKVFGADNWQLHRTHWSVRSGKAEDVLRRLSDALPEAQENVAAVMRAAQPIPGVDPPPIERMTCH